MNTKTVSRQEVVIKAGGDRCWLPRLSTWVVAIGVTGLVLAGMHGCTPEEEAIPSAKVKTVEAYGVMLDASAAPTDVAYVLLRSLADDVAAAQSHKHEEQEAANHLTFSLAAFEVIEARMLNFLNQNRPAHKKKSSLGDARAKKLFTAVNYWAPIVAHYVRSFDTERGAAKQKMREVVGNGGKIAHVYYPVVHDPAQTDPAQQERAIIDIELAKVKGNGAAEAADANETGEANSYWRVVRVGFRAMADRTKPHPTTQSAKVGSNPA